MEHVGTREATLYREECSTWGGVIWKLQWTSAKSVTVIDKEKSKAKF
jgi:hypothetical protein